MFLNRCLKNLAHNTRTIAEMIDDLFIAICLLPVLVLPFYTHYYWFGCLFILFFNLLRAHFYHIYEGSVSCPRAHTTGASVRTPNPSTGRWIPGWTRPPHHHHKPIKSQTYNKLKTCVSCWTVVKNGCLEKIYVFGNQKRISESSLVDFFVLNFLSGVWLVGADVITSTHFQVAFVVRYKVPYHNSSKKKNFPNFEPPLKFLQHFF